MFRFLTRLSAVGERLARTLTDEHARFAIDDGFDGATFSQGNNGAAAGLGLDRNDAEVLGAGEERGFGRAVALADLLVRLPAQERHARTGQALELRSFGTACRSWSAGHQAAGRP